MAGQRIIDCCSLINLYAGWGGLVELRQLGGEWFVGDVVLAEAQYVLEPQADGTRVRAPFAFEAYVIQGLLVPARPETEAEMTDFIGFAEELDDGEAQALALAKHRGWTLLTDERKATRIARREDVNVQTLSTAQLLKVWGGVGPVNASRLREVLQRIEIRARFSPPKETADSAWWDQVKSLPP